MPLQIGQNRAIDKRHRDPRSWEQSNNREHARYRQRTVFSCPTPLPILDWPCDLFAWTTPSLTE